MHTLEKKFIKPGKISDYLKCPICFEVFTNATRLYCGHTFCEVCLKDSMKIGNTCPECRAEINKKQIGNDLLARQIINDLDVFCSAEDCPWKGKYHQLEQHCTRNCSFFQQQNGKKFKRYLKDVDVESQKKDDEVIQKINENTVKGSLTARIIAKSDSFRDYKSQPPSEYKQKPSGKIVKKGRRIIKELKNEGEQAEKEVKKTKSSNFQFLESLFE